MQQKTLTLPLNLPILQLNGPSKSNDVIDYVMQRICNTNYTITVIL